MPITFNGDGTITGNTSILGHLSVSAQPCMLLTDVVDENMNTNDNDDPIAFVNTVINTGSISVNTAKKRITVGIAGTYLVTANVSGQKTNAGSTADNIIFKLLVNGATVNPAAYPNSTFGDANSQEFAFDFVRPIVLSANDYLEVALAGISGSIAEIKFGYFSVIRLH